MPSADRKNLPPAGEPPRDEPAPDAAPAGPSAPPASLSNTLKTGAAFNSTWRVPSLRPFSPTDPAQSGVRRLDLPSPTSGRTLHDLFSAPPAPTSPAPVEPGARDRVTLTDLPNAPPPGAPRGDWVAAVPVGPRSAPGFEVGRRERVTDPMGMTRVSPADLQPRPAAPRGAPPPDEATATRTRVMPGADTPGAQAPHAAPARSTPDPRLDPARQDRQTHQPPSPQALPWGLIASSVALIAGLGAFALLRGTEPAPDPDMNVVMPLVQAPAEAEPVRTSVKVSERTAVEPGSMPSGAASAAEPVDDALAVQQTLLESEPSGAEVVVRGAVIANTPAQVPLPDFESEYLLRKTGYRPELVRIGPGSPKRVQVQLKSARE